MDKDLLTLILGSIGRVEAAVEFNAVHGGGLDTGLTAPDGALEQDLIEVVNKHIRSRQADDKVLHPQIAAETVTVMACDMLRALSWLPPHLAMARGHLLQAIMHFRAGE